MKKSLIALAVLAASGAAMAQSTVTLYGIADVWFGSVKTDTGGVSKSTTSMVSGGVSTSRWGMKGAEDLGGGLKANFNFEQAVSVDSGAAANFARESWVGLSGGFGEVRLGLTGTPYDKVQGAFDGVFDSDLAPANNPGGGVFRTSNDANGKPGNQIYYGSPTIGGFAGAVSYALGEDPRDGVTVATAITSFNVTYAAGPLGAQIAYQKEDKNNSANDLAYTRVGAGYNFGVATAKFMYGKVKNTGNTADANTTEWQLGADVPVSDALTLSASYATSKDNAATAPAKGEVKRSGYGVGAAYALSKRTTLYGGLKKVKDDQGVNTDVDTTVVAAGIKHVF